MGLRTRIAVTREIEYLRLTKVSVHLQGTRVHFAQTVQINRPPCPVPIRSKCVNHVDLRSCLREDSTPA